MNASAVPIRDNASASSPFPPQVLQMLRDMTFDAVDPDDAALGADTKRAIAFIAALEPAMAAKDREIAKLRARLAALESAQAEAPPERPVFQGRWSHGQGFVACGGTRVLRADFDTHPSAEVRQRFFDWLCKVMNESVDRWRNHHMQEQARQADAELPGDAIASGQSRGVVATFLPSAGLQGGRGAWEMAHE